MNITIDTITTEVSVTGGVTYTVQLATSGLQGIPGPGVPAGGTTGQILAKTSGDDYDTEWQDHPSVPVQSVDGRTGDVTLSDLYDIAGAAESARIDAAGYAAAAESNAKSYADGLAVNYDPAGAAAAVTTTSIGAIPTSAKGAAGGVASLGNDGLVPTSQLPPLTSALADLTDVALDGPASGEVLTYNGTDWANASLPPGGVTSVNSQTGAVVLDYTDVGADPAGAAAAVTTTSIGAIPTSEKGAASGVATLGVDGLIPNAQLPAIAITDTFVVASQSAMLALTAETGDVAVRTDVSKSFILTATPASTLGNWQELLTPPDTVTSVNSKTGNVTLTYSDVGADAAGAAAAITLSGLGGVPTTRTVNGKALSADVSLSYSDVGADAAGAAAAVTTTSIGAVPTGRTVNGKALSADITLSASDVGADPAGSAAAVTTISIGAVPTSRTVNGHALSSNVTVTSADLGLKTQRRHDWVTNTSYEGTAVAGLAEGTTGWTLTKIVVSSAGATTVTHATDSWSNHLVAVYT